MINPQKVQGDVHAEKKTEALAAPRKSSRDAHAIS